MQHATDLEQLDTTSSGSVRKKDAMQWLNSIETPDERELIGSVVPKRQDHSGSAFPTSISQVRVTGDPVFVERVAALFQWFLTWESSATRLAVKVQQIEDRDTGEFTDNYALYLSAAERGRQGAMREALLGGNRENDQRLLDAVDEGGR